MTDTMLQCTFKSPARSFRLMSTLTPSAQDANAGVCRLTNGRQTTLPSKFGGQFITWQVVHRQASSKLRCKHSIYYVLPLIKTAVGGDGPRRGLKVVKQVSFLLLRTLRYSKETFIIANSIQMYLFECVGTLKSDELFFISQRTPGGFGGDPEGKSSPQNDKWSFGPREKKKYQKVINNVESSPRVDRDLPRAELGQVSGFATHPKDVSNLYLSHIRLTIRKTHCN